MSPRRDRQSTAGLAKSASAALVAALPGLLSACANEEPPPPAPPAIVYSADLQGAARLCNTPKQVTLVPGQTAETQMVVGNEGGWCAISVAVPGAQPTRAYDAGLLTTRPAHGKVYVHEVGFATRIDYTPEPGYAGADAFTVELLPGSPRLHVSVTVQPAGGGAPARGTKG